MQSGWIKVYRKVIDSNIWTLSSLHFKAFTWLLLKANHKPNNMFLNKNNPNLKIRRGEIITSYQNWAEGIKWKVNPEDENWIVPSRQNMRTIKKNLQLAGVLTDLPTGGCLHLRIDNYEFYQLNPTEPTDLPTELSTDPQHTPNRPLTPIEEGKELKKRKRLKSFNKESTTMKIETGSEPLKAIIKRIIPPWEEKEGIDE